jgi:hypothetical protein
MPCGQRSTYNGRSGGRQVQRQYDAYDYDGVYGYNGYESRARYVSPETREKLRQRALQMPRDARGRFVSPRRH